MIFTFDKHPLYLIDSERAPKLITDNETKSAIFGRLGIDTVYYRNVDEGFLMTDPQSFLNDTLYKTMNVRAIVAGFNFRFGYKGSGDSNLLMQFGKEKGIYVRIVNPFYINNTLVSSTAIRNFLKDGDIKSANMLLKREFSMHGRVVHGEQRGRKMGFPTANIIPEKDMIVPKNGVYVTKVNMDGDIHTGITNIGYNPTFGNNSISIETYMIGFEGDIYDREIMLEFYGRIRDEKKYSGMAALTSQLNADKKYALRFFEQDN
jgi:riboflavin kinase/FMN adenylyltransferase